MSITSTKRNFLDATFDAALQLKDSVAQAASGPSQVGGVNRVVNVGTGYIEMTWNVDIAAYDRTSGDETYDIRLQVSSDPNFASDVTVVSRIEIGTPGTTGEINTPVGGRRQIPVNNVGADGQPKQYIRGYTIVGGTTPTITHSSFLSQDIL